jgi:hypothetical protein
MRYDRKKELPAAVPDKATLLRSKSTVILIRWPVVLISCSLVVFRAAPTHLSFFIELALALYALSNISLYFVDESRFHELQFIFWLIALDTVVLTASLMVNGRAETNLYLAYFCWSLFALFLKTHA